MEKIVIMSGGTDKDSTLVKCLKKLFPECEIDIRPRMPKDDSSPDPVSDEKKESELNKNIEKYLSFL